METFNRYDYRNDAEAIQAAEAHIEELEQQRDKYFAIATERALELQRLREALQAHNAECDALCREDCVYRTTYTKTKCPDCPKDWKIEEGE